MRTVAALAASLLLVMAFFSACSEERSSMHASQPTSAVDDTGASFAKSACPGSLSLAVVATTGYDAIENGTQCEDDLYYENVNGEVSVCRLFLVWDDGSTRYSWEDKRQAGTSGCLHYGSFFPADAFLMQESVERLMTALDDPAIYDRCFAAIDPVNGEEFYSYVFDDPNDPSGTTVRRNLILIKTPNTTCN